ncbi:MAG: VOC family protein [Acidimicrobiales bacterium]
MSRVSNYLNFNGNAEEAFAFYAQLFGTELTGPIARFRDMPANVEMPPLPDEELDLVMHAELPILNGFVLMATDLISSMGSVRPGNNVSINLEVDTKEEADRLYDALSVGDPDVPGMRQEFFGYWGSCQDRFGVRWIVITGN